MDQKKLSIDEILQLLDSSPNIIYVYSIKKGRYEYLNQAVAKITGYQVEEFYKLSLADIISPHWKDFYEEQWQKLVQDSGHKFSYQIITKDGEAKWVEETGYTDADTGRIIGFIQNINDKKKLEELKAQYEQLLEASPDAVVLTNPQGRIIHVSKRLGDIFQYQPVEKLKGRSVFEFIKPQEQDQARYNLRKLLKEGMVHGIEHEMFRTDGTKLIIEFNASLIRDKDGEPFQIITTLRDITSRKQIAEALKQEKNRFKALSENTPFGMVLISREGVYEYINPKFTEILGYTLDDIPSGSEWFQKAFPDPIQRRKAIKFWKDDFAQARVGDKRPRIFEVTTKDLSQMTIRFIPSLLATGDFLMAIEDITREQKAITKLQQSEEKYKSLIENLNVGIFRTEGHLNGGFVEVNPALAKIYGYDSVEDFKKLKVSDLYVDPEQRSKIIGEIRKKKYIKNKEVKLLKNDGRSFWGSVTATAQHDEKGRIKWIDGIVEDISDKKAIEDALIRSEAYYRTIFENTGTATVMIDNDTTICLANSEFERLVGISKREIEGKMKWTDFVPSQDVDQMLEYHHMRRVNPESVPRVYEAHVLAQDQEEKNVILEVATIPGTMQSVASMLDVTALRKKDEALKKSEKLYRLLADNATDMISIHSLDGVYQYASPACKHIFGYQPSELVGKDAYLFIHPEDLENVGRINQKVIQDAGVHIIVYRIKRKDGEYIWVESTARAVRDKGRIKEILTITRDITDRKLMNDQIKQSLQDKELLLREIHHRVKNNMQIVSSLLNLQSQYVEGEETQNVLQESQNRVRAMAMIHEKLYQSPDLSHISFTNYIKKLVDDLLYSYGSPGNIKPEFLLEDIQLDIDTAIPLGLIVNELVTNSIKYAYPKTSQGTINIILQESGDKYQLIISDQGVGIPLEIDLEHTKTLGLQLVNNLVRQLDGEILLDRKSGSTFKIIFSNPLISG